MVLVAYIPPYYNAQQNASVLSYINDALTALKAKYDDPYIIVGGDFNGRRFVQAVREHPEIKSVTTGPTRNDAVLDIVGSNMNDTG